MEVIGYHIGAGVLICIGAILLLIVFVIAIAIDGKRPSKPKLGNIFEEEDEEMDIEEQLEEVLKQIKERR